LVKTDTAAKDEFDDENQKLEAEQSRLEKEKAAFAKQKALDEKRQQIAEEKERLTAEKEEARQTALERKQAKKTIAMAKRHSVWTANEIKRDGRFIAHDDGTVLDTRTNLMWAAKDNGSNINWANAKSYCENYRGGGYTDRRMPTQDELAGLYDAGKTRPGACDTAFQIHVATELIDITCFAPCGPQKQAVPRLPTSLSNLAIGTGATSPSSTCTGAGLFRCGQANR
jgi:hypothetical protein